MIRQRAKLPIRADVVRLRASICRESFFDFVQEFWFEICGEEPIWNWHIEYLCQEYQTVLERVFRDEPKEYDLIVNIAPGSTKSILSSIMLPAWSWTRMPSFRWICASHAFDLGMDLSRKCRDLVLSQKYQETFPDVTLRLDQATKSYFVNTRKGMRYVATVAGKSPIGFHAHGIVVDDPLDPTAARAVSKLDLEAANVWMNEVIPNRKVDKGVTPTILVMQRLHVNDPSGNRLASAKSNDIKHICIPAKLTEDVRPKELKQFYKEDLFDPIRLPLDVLQEIETRSNYAYAGQYLQRPSPLGGGDFHVGKIGIVDAEPANLTHVVRYWDKAGTLADGDYTVGVKMATYRVPGQKNPEYYVLDVTRGRWDSSTREQVIRQVAEMDGPTIKIGIEQEPGSSGKESAEATVRNLAGFRVMVDRVTGSKQIRADPFSSQVNAGNVKMRRAPWNQAYIEELTFFPRGVHDDQVDASSGAFAMLVHAPVRVGAF